MADEMELVIKIPREVYIAMCYNLECDIGDIKNIIRNGTPLPERHGDLKDMGNLPYMFDLTREDFIYSGKDIERTVKAMTTIVKPNKEEQTKKKEGNEYD